MDKIEEAKQVLAKEGYYVGNLWTDQDVQSQYECTREEAMQILDAVLVSDRIIGEINEAIGYEAENNFKLNLVSNENSIN